MSFMMPSWHVTGDQNLSNETYKTTPEMFMEKTHKMVEAYTVRNEGPRNYPVVRPPPGGMFIWSRGSGISGQSSSWNKDRAIGFT